VGLWCPTTNERIQVLQVFHSCTGCGNYRGRVRWRRREFDSTGIFTFSRTDPLVEVQWGCERFSWQFERDADRSGVLFKLANRAGNCVQRYDNRN